MSFIFPIIRKKIHSAYSGCLELTLSNGKKLLNSLNTNYSYGSLQKVLKFSLTQVELSKVSSVLVLGLGGGCVVKVLRNDFNYGGSITAVEIDPVIISIADKEFSVVADYATKIICADAFDWVKNDVNQYDMVIVDLFIDNKVPDQFLTDEFWRRLLLKISFQGSIIFNTLCFPSTNLQPLENKLKRRGVAFKVFRYVESTNKVLIANYA